MKAHENGLSLPALNVTDEYKYLYTDSGDYKVQLYSDNRQLLISKNEVILVKGFSIEKKLCYEEEIVAATYTHFGAETSNRSTEALVVCFRKCAHINYQDGEKYVVSFPFHLINAFSFESGLVLEKDQAQNLVSVVDGLYQQQLLSAKFLSLVDPNETFGMIASSSTSVISPYEKLMYFPTNRGSSICATYNTHERIIILYHVRSPTRTNKKSSSLLPKQVRRKYSFHTTPSYSRIHEDDTLHLDLGHRENINSNTSVSGTFLSVPSLNMEKKRTSTLLSDVSSMTRMSSESGISDSKAKGAFSPVEFGLFRKDMILTKLDSFYGREDIGNFDVHGLVYEDQEAVVIINKTKKLAVVNIYAQQSSHVPKYHSSYAINCKNCIPLENHYHEGYLVVLKDDNSIILVNPFIDVVSYQLSIEGPQVPIKSLECSFADDVVLRLESGDIHIHKLLLDPTDEMTAKCLHCLKFLSGSKIQESVWMIWCTALLLDDENDDWNAFVVTLLSIIYPFENIAETEDINLVTKLLPKARLIWKHMKLQYSLLDLVPFIVISLHLIREEYKLNTLNQNYVNKIGLLLAQLTYWIGWPDTWFKYYMIDLRLIEHSVKLFSVSIIDTPPNLLASLYSILKENIIPYVTLSQIVEETEAVDQLVTPRTFFAINFFKMLASPKYQPKNAINMMNDYGISLNELNTFPIGISIPLKEAIQVCQENPEFEWNSDTLDLVGRKDLSLSLDPNTPTASFAPYTQVSQGPTKDINFILSNLLDKSENVVAWDGQSEADRINITKLIFDYDRRYFEITSLLHQTKTQQATMVYEETTNEYDLFVLQRELAAIIAHRTLSLPLGRAALFYDGRMPLLTEKFPIPKFNFNTLIAPTMTNIVLSNGSINEEVLEWGYFHNGVSSGLSISKESKGISGSWIIFNKPPELNAQHAGFLLGLGLNGHLKKLEEWHIYNYLGPKHPLTSVGLLIGMAASVRGSMDTKLTKVLSVHAVALLPQGANDLNVPVIVQTAGVLGIGLLYLETQHRRMSEVLLSQITASVSQNDTEQIHETYRLASGIALGYVNLGKGDDLRGLNDTHVVDRLVMLAVAMKDFHSEEELDKSSAGAILALAFIYMKSNNVAVANKLCVPDTEQLLDYIRPDIVLLRLFAKNLIMWDNVENTIRWVEKEIPASLFEKYGDMVIEGYNSDQITYLNALGGCCLSIAIRYASTHDTTARDTLLHYLDMLMSLSPPSNSNFDQEMAFKCAINIQNVIALGLTVIMTGSGDLEIFRRLRVLFGRTTPEIGYGSYLAISTALGFLFLGGGQYSFSESNFATASLVTALVPVYPTKNTEAEMYLQTLRHFWALSVEPRCLVVRDVGTQKPCKIPIAITLKNGKVIETLSPYLLPKLGNVAMIATYSSDHFNVQIDFTMNSEYLEIFKKSLTIYVYKNHNYLMLSSSIGSMLKHKNKNFQIENGEISVDSDIASLLNFQFMENISDLEKKILLHEYSENSIELSNFDNNSALSIFNIIDIKIELELLAKKPHTVEQLWNLKLLFAFADNYLDHQLHFITLPFIEKLKQYLWKLSTS